MRRLTTAALLWLASFIALSPLSHVAAQDARQRQAAAEAYDRGTAAYLDGDYTEAAQWFETADRMAPAAPALMQAVRSHQRAEHFARAATLALHLQEAYGSVAVASEYAASVLADLAPQFLRVDVTCNEECKLDLDGKLQEFHSFFLEPGTKHTIIASFDTGSKTEEVEGTAGATRALEFEAPPPPPDAVTTDPDEPGVGPTDADRKPLPPFVTFIGVGVTGVLLVGTVLSGLDTVSGVDKYKKAAGAATDCGADTENKCKPLYDDAREQLDAGESKEMRTNILVAATAVAAVGTGIIALFLTDWSGDSSSQSDTGEAASLRVTPTLGGVYGMVEGRF